MGAGLRMYAKGPKTAEVLIYEDVGEGWFGGVSAKTFTEDLRSLGALDHIDVRINSYGGDVFEGLAIYNTLVRHGATVHTHIDGVAASIASIIAMAGSEIHAAENGWLMIHDAWGIAVGSAADLRQQAELLDSVSAKLGEVYAGRTGLAIEDVRALMREETWLDAETALDRGFVSSITENLKAAAHAAPQSLHKFRHLPRSLAGSVSPRSDSPQRQVPVSLSAEEQALRATVEAQATRVRRAALLSAHRVRGAATSSPAPVGVTSIRPKGGTAK